MGWKRQVSSEAGRASAVSGRMVCSVLPNKGSYAAHESGGMDLGLEAGVLTSKLDEPVDSTNGGFPFLEPAPLKGP